MAEIVELKVSSDGSLLAALDSKNTIAILQAVQQNSFKVVAYHDFRQHKPSSFYVQAVPQ